MENKISKRRFVCNKYIVYSYIIGTVIFFASMFFGPWLIMDEWNEPNMYKVFVRDTYVGDVRDKQTAHECLQVAKESVSADSEEITFMDAGIRFEGEHTIFGLSSSTSEIIAMMTELLKSNVQQTLQRSYMLKINNYLVALSSISEVEQVLQTVVDQYDSTGGFDVILKRDTERAFNVLTAEVVAANVAKEERIGSSFAGFTSIEDTLFNEDYYQEELGFSDFEEGIWSMNFLDKIEITECYLKSEDISTMEEAIQYLTQDQSEEGIYKVVAGDTLSGISISTGIPMEELIALNDALESENSIINIGQELIVSIPKAPVTLEYVETQYREEEYSAEIQYIENDDWYTTKQVTLQEPSNGFRKAVSNITYHNGEEYIVEVLKQEVLTEAVPKIVERGTKIPPTYIKPLAGGRLSSGFGYRSFRGGSNHYGVDWATPTGTTIYASSGGTVTRAGWSSSYGYCVYIQHPDGVETRYAHNSKLLVKVGQTVKQGEAIALSGNTGDSYGAHLHFEIRVNGKPIDPYSKGYLGS